MMLTVQWEEHQQPHPALQRISARLAGSRKIVAVTGAGISVSAGIPDFRSAEGLYARVLSAPEATGAGRPAARGAKGKDFFDASFFNTPETRPLFNRFVAELRDLCAQGKPTATHHFLKELVGEQRLLRWYTQNIDGLERACGLRTSTCVAEPHRVAASRSPSTAPVVSLHGTLERLICTLCKSLCTFTSAHEQQFRQGESPECERCATFSKSRQACGRRAVRCGVLRPDIVLYNEPHPQGEAIAELLSGDLHRQPNLLLVMGTSLKVVGLKKMVKDLARAVKSQPDGLVIFINRTPAARSEWKTVFDYELIGECDNWVQALGEAMRAAKILLPPAASRLASPSARPTVSLSTPRKDGRIDRMLKVVRRTHSPALDAKKDHHQPDTPAKDAASQPRQSPSTSPSTPVRPVRILRNSGVRVVV